MERFSAWARVIGGILEHVGVSGLLENRAGHKAASDSDGAAWGGFVGAWHEARGESSVTSAELFPMALEWIADKLGDGQPQSQKIKLGRILQNQTDRIYHGLKITRQGNKTSGDNKGAALYALRSAGKIGESGESGDDDSLPRKGVFGEVDNTIQYTHIGSGETLSPLSPLSPITLTAQSSQEAFARVVAQERKRRNEATRKQTADRGSDQRNAEGDYTGAFGEVLAVQFLEAQAVPAADWQPLEPKPVPRPDITAFGVPLEIKTSSPGAKSFCVNEEQRVKFSAIPDLWYWPVIREGENRARLCKPVPAAEVATWQLLTPADNPKISSPCRSIPFDCLEPLRSTGELLNAPNALPPVAKASGQTLAAMTR